MVPILPKSLAIIFMMESSSNTSRVGFEYGFDMFAVRFEGAGTISTTSLGARLFPLSSTASVPAVEPSTLRDELEAFAAHLARPSALADERAEVASSFKRLQDSIQQEYILQESILQVPVLQELFLQ